MNDFPIRQLESEWEAKAYRRNLRDHPPATRPEPMMRCDECGTIMSHAEAFRVYPDEYRVDDYDEGHCTLECENEHRARRRMECRVAAAYSRLHPDDQEKNWWMRP